MTIRRVLPLIIALLFSTYSYSQLPEDFPGVTVTQYGDAAPGNVFLSTSASVEGTGYYVFLLNNEGEVQGYKELDGDYAYDFKMQPNGMLSYAQFISHHSYTGGGNVYHVLLDQQLTQVDSIQMKNGYIAEAHDFQLLPNGHMLMFGYYLTQMDLSELVDGGFPDAKVSGGIIQEWNADGDVVFQWRTWDYYTPEEYQWGARANRQTVSAFHLNTINLDIDGNIIVATPSFNKKLNRKTGEIMWHLGGYENEFSFVGVDSTTGIGYVTGHAFYRIDNGNFLVYDNAGRTGSNKNSEVHEFHIDEINKIASLIWTYAYPEDFRAWHRGNAQRLPNGNTMIGWGGALSGDTIPTATEVDADKNIVWEARFDAPTMESYRAFRFPMGDWKQADAVEIELAEGNSYEFFQGDTLYTGVDVDITTLNGFGYNELTVKTYDQAPQYPAFSAYGPMLHARRVTLQAFNMLWNGKVYLEAASFDINNPEEITIWHRPQAGQGEFSPLNTIYNFVTGKIVADIDVQAETIYELAFGFYDLEPEAYPPMLHTPDNNASVFYEDPLFMEWSPVGQYIHFDLEIATDIGFTDIVVQEYARKETYYNFTTLEKETYYWRVKAYTNSQTGLLVSDWSETYSFDASEAEIELTAPIGAEKWEYGLKHFILWEDNFQDDVIIELFAQDSISLLDTLHSVIDETASDGAYQWEIPVDTKKGCKYRIRISDLSTQLVVAESPQYFSITDTTGDDGCSNSIDDKINLLSDLQLYPNPAHDHLQVNYTLLETQSISITLYTIQGREVMNVFEGVQVQGSQSFDISLNQLQSGIYLLGLKTNSGMIHRKIVVQ